MVKIINYKKRSAIDGRTFFALILQGQIEMLKSEKSGEYYASSMQASVQSTLDEESCKLLIGQELEGKIEKIEVESYSYQIPKSDKVIELKHSYRFIPEYGEADLKHTGEG